MSKFTEEDREETASVVLSQARNLKKKHPKITVAEIRQHIVEMVHHSV